MFVSLVMTCGSTLAWDALSFDVPSGSKEAVWRDALASKLDGITEHKTSSGRIDVITSNCVIELDWPSNWKSGMGQALAYAGATGRQPVLALMAYGQGEASLQAKSRALFDLAEKECSRHGVRLLVLFPTRPEDFPHTKTNKVDSSSSKQRKRP
jgi:hypothetical protein